MSILLSEVRLITAASGDTRGHLECGDVVVPCSLGRSGIAADKREGDGATPIGLWPMRRLFYRPDKVGRPVTALESCPIERQDGWCDDPRDPNYNRPVELPYPASAETMWRDDDLYDLVVVLGHNDSPPVPGRGSAIFMHVARPDWGPTEGCIALRRDDLLNLLTRCGSGTIVRVG